MALILEPKHVDALNLFIITTRTLYTQIHEKISNGQTDLQALIDSNIDSKSMAII